MAVKIRLARHGMKKQPFYRVVVTDSRNARNGQPIEEIGWYNPLKDPAEYSINNEKALKWMASGAQPSETVRMLLKKSGAIS